MSSEHRVELQPAYLLHRKPFRDTSLLLEVFSRDHGRLGLVARGAQGPRSKLRGVLQPYQLILFSWRGRGELSTLVGAEAAATAPFLQGDAIASGFYLNELMMRLLARHDPHPQLFARYGETLAKLQQNEPLDWTLRLFERDLLQELGYGLLLSHEGQSGAEVEQQGRYCYYHESGPRQERCKETNPLCVHGATLLALESGRCDSEQTRKESKRLMREILSRYLGTRPLASRELFRQKRTNTKSEE